jgi:signal transduction histidine kinase/ligand-binding sensor domain-containing protein
MRLSTILGIFALALSLLLPTARPAALAQSPVLPGGSVRFKHIDVEQGLANSRVLSILQDRQGFMWFGTGEGLNRYDGYDFIHYRTDDDDPQSLSGNVVWALYEDRAGYLWVGTDGGGLNRFDPASETFARYLPDPDDPTSISDATVLSIHEDQDGILWVGTQRGGINRFDRESNTFTHYQNDPADPQSLGGNEVKAIVEDASGTLWVGTYGGGLNQLVPGKSAGDPPTFRRFQHDPTNVQSLSHDLVQTLHVDRLGALWVGTWGGGLNRFDTVTETFAHYRTNPDDPASLSSDTISALHEGPDGELWVGTWDGGLNRFARASETFVRYQHDPADSFTLSRNLIRSLYISQDGLLFVGTAGGGLNVLNLNRTSFQALRHKPGNPNSLSQNDVRAILQAREGVLWIGTQSGGLIRYDPSTGQFTHYRHDPDDPTSLSNNSVFALSEDPDGTLWVGTFGGLNKLDRKTGQFAHYTHDPANPRSLSDNTVWELHLDRTGTLWVGAYGGLNRFDRETESFTRYLSDPADPASLSHNAVSAFYEDSSGDLWLGTVGGLNRMDRRTETFTRYLHDPNDPASIISDSYNVIYGDPNGVLWLGTFEGLDQFDPANGRAVHYTMDDGLSSNVVYGILPDEQGNLWISTNHGLNRFDPRTKEFRTYDADDGLVSSVFNGFAYHKGSSGELFFGSPDGLVVFDPAQITDDTYIAPLVFTDFQLANRSVSIGGDSLLQQSINQTEDLTLSYLDRVISFSFAALNYRTPQKIRYRYTLRGFDTHWTEVDSKRRYVTYTNLGPGRYTFLVQSSDRNGRWNTPGRSLNLVITPAWWQTLWFRLALGGLLLLTVAGAYRFRVMMLQQRNLDLEKQVAYRTKELQVANADLEQSVAELSTLNQVAQSLNQTAPLDSTLEEMAVIITKLFQATGSAICLASVDRTQLNVIDYHEVAALASPHATTNGDSFQLATASIPMPQALPLFGLFGDGKSVVFDGTRLKRALPPFWQNSQLPNMTHLMLVPIMVRGEVAGTIAVARAQPELGFVPNEVTLAETMAHQVAGAYENNRLFQEEHQQRQVVEQRSRELSTLLTISQDVSSMLELEPLLHHIMEHLNRVIDFSTLILLGLEGEELFILAQRGISPSDLTMADEFPIEWLQAETDLFTTRSPLICADLAQDPHLQAGMCQTFGPKLASLFHEKTHACMAVPMVARDRIVGLLWFGHIQPECYSQSQADYVAAIANQAAIAIENAHYHQAMQTAAADRERNRLAQELHDSVSQTLLAANRVAESLPDLWEQSPEQGKYALRQVHRMMQNALAEMRTLMLELRPAVLAQKPLGEILRQLRDGFASRTQLPVQLQVNGDAILPALCQVFFYRIAQGALNNIQQHAQASQVTIELNCMPQFVEMRIADDGVGFDPAAVPADRMGLTIMRERAEKIGATFQVDTKPGQGTQITVRYTYPIG